jgi:SAM-dependent methyltransferase
LGCERPDIYIRVTEAPPNILEGLMIALETRAADPQQRAMLNTYLSDAALPANSRVIEIGCGTGALTRALAAWPGVAEAIGVDPSPVGMTTLSFQEADGRSLPFGDNSFDAVVFHTTLCHVSERERCCVKRCGFSGRVLASRYLRETTPQLL